MKFFLSKKKQRSIPPRAFHMNAQGRTVEMVPLFLFTLADLTSSVKKSK